MCRGGLSATGSASCCGSQFELRHLREGISQVRVEDVEGRMTFGAGHGGAHGCET